MKKNPKKGSDKTEQSSFSRRAKRYVEVSSAMTGLAARLAGQKYLNLDINRPVHAKNMMESLGNLKGPLLKIAQLLATIPEALPKEYAMEMQKLQSQAPSMGWPFVRRRMIAELGSQWEKKFHSFDKEAAAAASLGQVHKAVTLEGIDVACKLQYPEMTSTVEADLKQLKIFLGFFEKYDHSIVTSEIQKEIAARLHEELDYHLEASYTGLYDFMLKDEKAVHVPKIMSELSTDRLLTATWLNGKGILKFTSARKDRRNRLALNLFRAWYVPLYYYGVLHGDPHFGNYTVRKDDSINLMDFGCVRVFQPKFVQGVITLYRALQKNDDSMAVEAYESWGFKNLNKRTINALNMWARFLYGPVLDNKVRTIGVVTKGIYGHEIAHEVHKELRESGGVRLPREFVFMDRAALGLGSVFLHLKAEVNWYKLFNELIEDFDVGKLEKRQKTVLQKFNISTTSVLPSPSK